MTARILSAVALMLVAFAAASAGARQASLQEIAFDRAPFASVDRPTLFRYRYLLRSSRMADVYESEARMEVREVGADGRKLVWFDMFDGPNHRVLGPTPAVDQNPMLFVFLQRDVATMANLTGGARGYFQQQLRRALAAPAEVESVRVRWDGREIEASRLQLRPFAADPQIDRFPQFRDKIYEFVFAPEIPGGFYSFATRLEDPAGGVLFEETLMLEAVH